MPQPPEKKPDRHYDFGRLNKVFAFSAFALLAITVWMVVEDYAKPWKRYQDEFRDLERQQLERQAEAERQQINETELTQLREDVAQEEARLAERRTEAGELDKTLTKLGKKIYAADAKMRTTKSLLDTARYEYDHALQERGEREIEKTRLEKEGLETEWRENRKQLELFTEQRDQTADELAQMQAAQMAAEDRLTALRKGVANLEQRAANLEKGLDYYILNAPLMDIFQPDLKIEQVMVPGLYHDINFTKVERVDRCVTCHVAANRQGFDDENWQPPYRSHPRMDLFVGAGSPHPYTEFGCSSCHGGLDRATNFARAGHSPSDTAEKDLWAQDLDWETQPYLETPIYPAEYSEAGCVTCHSADVWTPGSEMVETGRELATKMGCFVCHKIDYPAFQNIPRPGPNLASVAGKTDPAWAYKWIEAPREFRATTWMPHFFFQQNTTSDTNWERQKAEIVGIVAYLWDLSRQPEYPEPPAGDAERGQALFDTVGCTGCHLMDAEAARDEYFPQINRLHGPNLIRTGSKVSAGWLYAWIKDPKQYAADTRMPSLRLTDQEAADITTYLMASRDPEYEELSLPEVDSEVRDQIVLTYLQNNQTIEQSIASLEAMSARDRDVFLGGQTIQKYGCWGCHDLSGFEDAKPIGVELTEEGSKPLHQFDFGHLHDISHTRHDWILNKMLDPRSYDEGKEAVKNYEELLKMPNFGMSEREARAIVNLVLGFTKESADASRRAGQSARSAALAEGRKLITLYNCQGCHLVEGTGQAIRTSIEDVGMLPPDLASEGSRVQSDWLFEYLGDPGAIRLRPWLTARMPTFGFADSNLNTLVDYFAAGEERETFLSEPQRPGERELATGRVAFNMFQCAKCHPSGPQAASEGVSAGELAPSLLLARERLRHDWVAHWIQDPQSWIPGTKMPANFPKSATGEYSSPLAMAIDAPMFKDQKQRVAVHFDTEEELKSHLADAEYVTQVLRDHIWWNLD
jgi:cytochrome c2